MLLAMNGAMIEVSYETKAGNVEGTPCLLTTTNPTREDSVMANLSIHHNKGKKQSREHIQKRVESVKNTIALKYNGRLKRLKLDKSVLQNLYLTQGKSLRECCKLLGVKEPQTLMNYMDEFNIPRRTNIEALTGEQSPNWRGGLVTLICSCCGKVFQRKKSKLKTNIPTCSHKCQGRLSFRGGKYETRKRYYEKLGNKIKHYPHKILHQCKCDICGKLFLVKNIKKTHKHHTCSWECYAKLRSLKYSQKNHYNWQGGKSYEPYSHDFTHNLRELVRIRDNHQCQICGKQENGSKMDVHHIDYDKKNCSPSNLISLCHDCHTKTNYKREYWKEYFQSQFIFNPALKLAVNQ